MNIQNLAENHATMLYLKDITSFRLPFVWKEDAEKNNYNDQVKIIQKNKGDENLAKPLKKIHALNTLLYAEKDANFTFHTLILPSA